MKYQIAKGTSDRFELKAEGKSQRDRNADFNSMQSVLDREPCYLVAKPHGLSSWLLIFYMPEDCSVRDRMVYSSSSAALKEGLGSSNFSAQTWNISKRSECSSKELEESTKKMDDADILTWDEQQKIAAETSSHLAMSSVKVSAIVGLPIQTSDEACQAIKSMAAGQIQNIVFSLHPDSEILLVESSGSASFEDLAKKLPSSEPRYALSNFIHEHEGKQTECYVFLILLLSPLLPTPLIPSLCLFTISSFLLCSI